jgi:hypothetical protein
MLNKFVQPLQNRTAFVSGKDLHLSSAPLNW